MAESDRKPPFPVIREAVASFADKENFRRAVGRLLASGFKPADLSVLASHDSLEVAGDVPGYRGKPGCFGCGSTIPRSSRPRCASSRKAAVAMRICMRVRWQAARASAS